MDSPNRKGNTRSGMKSMTAPVAGMPQSRCDPNPRCQTSTSSPMVAPTERMFSSKAFTDSTKERNEIARITSVIRATSARMIQERP